MNKTDQDWAKLVAQLIQTVDTPSHAAQASSLQQSDLPDIKSNPVAIAQYIDHTLLKTDATSPQIDQLCEEAISFGFAAVCVRLEWVSRAINKLKNGTKPIPVASVIAFHEGTAPIASKIAESISAVQAGAKELDVVLNRQKLIPSLADGESTHSTIEEYGYSATFAELKAIRDAAPPSSGVHLKLILETSQLPREAVIAACILAGAAEWDYVKTSTGFCGRGASVEDVELMKACAQALPELLTLEGGKKLGIMKVKASGGVRTFEDAVKMVDAGASRIGASSGVNIVEEAKSQSKTS